MKNLLLSATSLLFTAAALAQLTVRPNPVTTEDSYVYVSDMEVFVTGEINLEKNAVGATEASIYLRNEAQLFQGNETNVNTGDGHLSVYQDNFGDTWDYTFWCSPVGLADASTGDTNFGIKRLYDVVDVTNSNQSTRNDTYDGNLPMDISKRWTYIHPAGDVNEPSFVRIRGRDDVPAGMGFTMRGLGTTNHVQNYDFRGRPNNGTMSVAIETNKYTLSGNPYPSALDLKLLWYDTDNSGDIGSIRYWDEDKNTNSYFYEDRLGGYASWTPGGPASDPSNPNGLYVEAAFNTYDYYGNFGTGGAIGASYNRRYAPIGQGFMVFGDANTNILIKNSHRIFIKESSGVSDFRTSDAGSTPSGLLDADVVYNDDGTINTDQPTENLSSPMYRIFVNFEDTYVRPLLLAFDDNTTDDYDNGWDARSPMEQIGVAEAYFPINKDGEKLPHVINALNFRNDVRVPLSIVLNEETKFEIKAVEEINISQLRPGLQAFVHDTSNDTYKQISDDNEAVYQLPTGEYLDRFYIVFGASRQSMEDAGTGVVAQREVQGNVDFFQNNRAAQLEVSNPEGYDIVSANIYDLNGKLVISQSNLGDSTRLTFPTGNLSDAVYIVKLMTSDNVAIDYKMTVYNNK